MNELDDKVDCPVCQGLEGHCERCDSTGYVRLRDLNDDERFALGLLPPIELPALWEGLD